MMDSDLSNQLIPPRARQDDSEEAWLQAMAASYNLSGNKAAELSASQSRWGWQISYQMTMSLQWPIGD